MAKKPELPPLEEKRPEVSSQKSVAGGIPSILSSMKHIIEEVGVIRGTRELLKVNQMKGFDCPGCAWPDPDDRREMTEFCENGAKAVAEEATRRRVTPEFFAAHSIQELSELSDFELGKSGRLTHPMILNEGGTHYEPIGWEQAFETIAAELNSLNSPHEANFYTSGRTSNEAAFVYQLLVRLYGTNNLPDCSNLCHESSGVALNESIGIGKATVKLEDFEYADCIVVIGQNPGTNHPRMLTALQKAAKRGAKIISINPLFETGLKRFKHPQEFWYWFGRGTPIAALHLPNRIQSDLAILKGIMKEMLAEEELNPGTIFNHEFIRNYTQGYESMIEDLRRTSWDDILTETGVSRENIRAAAEIIMKAKNLICCWAMGITQQKHAVGTIKSVVNLLLLGGHFGRRGTGACPVRGHSNVQGDRTVGIYEKPSAAFLNALEKEFHFTPPSEHGDDAVFAIHAMYQGRAKVFIGMGGNFLSATPDTEYTAQAIRNTHLTVHVSTKLNRSHLIHGKKALILPCLGRTEIDLQSSGPQFVSVENSTGVVHQSQGHLTPASGHLKSEVAIVCGLAKALFKSKPEKLKLVDWDKLMSNYDEIRNHIEKVIPGFDQYNERIRRSGGFYLPNGVRDSLTFNTPSGKAEFTTYELPVHPLPPGRLMMMTMRSHDQFNTTIYGLDDRYRGITAGRRVIFMNPDDIQGRGLQPGQWVDITSYYEGEQRTAERFMIVSFEIPKRCAASYFPEANVLVPIRGVARKSNTPFYKTMEISVSPSQNQFS